MKVYFEEVILLNFLLDFMILYGTKRILKISKSIFRIVLSSILGSFSTFLVFFSFSFFELLILKFFISFCLILISFGFSNILRNIFYFYMISVLLGGCFSLFDFSSSLLFTHLILLIGCFFLIFLLIREALSYRVKISSCYEVVIVYRKKKYFLEGMIDTGNQLKSPYNGESILLTNLSINTQDFLYIPYKALNTTGIIPCFRPDKVVINDREFSNCLVGLARDKFSLSGVNCILPNQFKEELC